jgi:hypothetical protein
VNGFQPAGFYSTAWDGTSVASGMYFARLHAGESIETIRLMLTK